MRFWVILLRKHAHNPCKHGGLASRQIEMEPRLEASVACEIQDGEINIFFNRYPV